MYDPLGIRCLNERLIRHSSGIFGSYFAPFVVPGQGLGTFYFHTQLHF